jgi:nucleoside-diphosphate-sugar epimerase
MILVTGSNGLVGRSAVNALKATEEEILGVDIHGYNTNSKPNFIYTDISIKEKVLELRKEIKPDSKIVHTAGIISDVECLKNPDRAIDVNVKGTLNLLELARLSDVNRFIYISSGGVYGAQNPNIVVTEESPTNPMSIYAMTKLSSEILVREYCKMHSITGLILRITSPYGAEMIDEDGNILMTDAASRHIPYFVRSCMIGKPIIMKHGGDHKINYTYVKDIAEAIFLSVFARISNVQILNISGGKNYSIKDIGNILSRIFPRVKIDIGNGDLTNSTEYDDKYMRRIGTNQGLFKIEKAKKLIGYDPKYSLEMGVNEMVNELKKMNKG